MKNIIDTAKVLNICNENNLSFEELFFCYLLVFNNENRNSEFNQQFKQYYSNNKVVHEYRTKIIEALEEAGFVENHNTSKDKVHLDKIIVTERAKKLLFDDKFMSIEEAWEDVMKCYPKVMRIQDKRVNARTASDMEKLKKYYYNSVIKGSRVLHREFIELTLQKFGEDTNKDRLGYCVAHATAEMGLEKYINSWTSNKELILENMINGDNKVSSKFAY